MLQAIKTCGSDVVQEFTTAIARAQAIAVGDGSTATAEAEQEPPFVKCAHDWTEAPKTCPQICQVVAHQWGSQCAKELMQTLAFVWEQFVSDYPSPTQLIKACDW
ncbi:hypothetical protein ABPG75_011881 [Micractinium tetrahymenae]